MRVAIIGCGVVGAAIAYELSVVPGLLVTVVDQHQPAQHSTGAALGVLMGAISQKLKGNNLRMRLFSIQRYNEWVPKLEIDTGRRILFNQQGILRLCFEGENLDTWKTLARVRQEQGWQLEMCDRAFLIANYPHLNLEHVIGAIYSPSDRQVDPTALTLALVTAAQQNGVTFQFDTPVTQVLPQSDSTIQLQTPWGAIMADWLVIAAGLGSTPLTTQLQQPVEIRPVLGQAVRVKMPYPLGNPNLQPVITGEDVHLVPLGDDQYWIGATVEFPNVEENLLTSSLQPSSEMLESVIQQAIAFCPTLQHATIQHQWYGLRPRPESRPAPIIEPLLGYPNILLATGHYRNGVLLAPATAAKVREAIKHI